MMECWRALRCEESWQVASNLCDRLDRGLAMRWRDAEALGGQQGKRGLWSQARSCDDGSTLRAPPMTPCHAHLVEIIQASRETLVQESTDIAFMGADAPIPRADVEQMLRACIALIEEALQGQSTEVRTSFLEAMPDIARSTTWDSVLENGIPCWGLILGRLVAQTNDEHRNEAIVFLSRFMGTWWRDVSRAMLPVYLREEKP
jgi:hypothetical protein